MILLHEYLAVRPILEEKTESGLFIPVEAQEKTLLGEIVYVGKDVEDEDIYPGVTVLYDKLNSSPFVDDLYLCEYSDLLAIKTE